MILLATTVITLAGSLYSVLAPSVYVARAVIYPQDVSANSEKSGFGGLTGALNPVLGISHLNRVEIILNSRETAREVLLKNNFMPLLFPDLKPFGDTLTPSQLNDGIAALQGMIATRVDVYKLTLEIKTSAGDSKLAFLIARGYLDALNDRMKETVTRNADANKEFLELQMGRTMDPIAKDKIQQLIIREIETSMLLNANGFELLDAPEAPQNRESPKRKQIILLAAILGFGASCVTVLAWRGVDKVRAELKSEIQA